MDVVITRRTGTCTIGKWASLSGIEAPCDTRRYCCPSRAPAQGWTTVTMLYPSSLLTLKPLAY